MAAPQDDQSGGYLVPFEMSEAIIDMPAYHMFREAVIAVVRWQWLGNWWAERSWNWKRTNRNFWRRMASVREVED